MRPPTHAEEFIAIAMCVADDLQPYEYTVMDRPDGGTMSGPRWWQYAAKARRFLAAFRALGELTQR